VQESGRPTRRIRCSITKHNAMLEAVDNLECAAQTVGRLVCRCLCDGRCFQGAARNRYRQRRRRRFCAVNYDNF